MTEPTTEPSLLHRVQAAVMTADIDVTSWTRPIASDRQYRVIAERLIRTVVAPERLAAAVLGAATTLPQEPYEPSPKMLRECANILETAPYDRRRTAAWMRAVADRAEQ